jgi:glycosyltransferase involved in cell wall biosynthesis
MERLENVLFLPRWYPSRYDPMPGLFIRRHAISVSEKFNVSMLYVHLSPSDQAKKFEIFRSDDFGIREVTVYYQGSRCKTGLVASIINMVRFFRANILGFRVVKKESGSPDIIHVNVLTRLGVIALIYKLLKGVPYVITEHWTRYLPGMDNFNGWLRKRLSRVVVWNASAVMPVTRNLQNAMELHGLSNNNYKVIPNVVNTSLFVPDYSKKDSSKALILHVSCFDDRQKNITGILRVLKRVSEKRTDWYCKMVGEGIDFQKITDYAKTLGLKDSLVEFTGLKENEELAKLMQQAEFQVMFSRYENFPVVIPESFACGVPFISTDVGGIAEYIYEEQGVLVQSENEDALLAAIEDMLDNRDRFNPHAIRQYALDNFSNEVIGNQIASVYRDVLTQKSSKS